MLVFMQVFCSLREVSFFTRRGGGLLKIGGDQVLCLRSKGGIKRFFQIKRGDHLYFLKKQNIWLNIHGILVNFTEKVVF